MREPNLFVFILVIIFIIAFFFAFNYTQSNKLIKYQVYKTPMDIDMEESVKEKKIIDCNKVCKQEVCDEYTKQRIKYDMCKECAKEMKCYDPNKGKCVFCFNFQSCENMYGCGDTKPIEPSTNFCNKCWPKIVY
jgi:hypothetical protein